VAIPQRFQSYLRKIFMEDKIHWVPQSIGMLVLSVLPVGIFLGSYPGWDAIGKWFADSGASFNGILTNSIAMCSAIAAAVSAFFAYVSLKHTRNTKADEMLLEHATTTISRAYEVLMEGSDSMTPQRNRMNWLTTARLIEDFKTTKKKLIGKEVKRRCEGTEDYWRIRFLSALDSYRENRIGFSAGNDDANSIYPMSALIVHSFADWPEDKLDDIDKYPSVEAAVQETKLSRKWFALHQYLGTWHLRRNY